MFFLTNDMRFPPVESASEDGIVAVGGDLSIKRLKEAYREGIFPWYDENSLLLWWSPDPRMVLPPSKVKISKSMRNVLNKGIFKVTYNTNFKDVIENCAKIERPGENGTWIHTEMIEAYTKLHNLGIAKSIEVWHNNELVGGLYGVDLGHIFCGESMFSKMSNASKTAFIFLARKLERENYQLLDCQLYTNHLYTLGAREIPRKKFIDILKKTKPAF
ncbi:leucyl/phenylalanyl-tRNA--protein transferase [Galbibacter pacificus]|uniref:Leucyl/phenylalanyl-tRNA--protein transferase n=1 Tax=Galbibacter pacificus TaxID=2996052 RepID=A0ABT6FT39_9FLAO|nr:leucyl/phenylalanyl-tRNA--protein transferase [Galbibacter pacificus]MDG3582444.1 leucyl/phenylalanyl-tRNA--protein transferase [Galbibacter pacificus]MDG3586438.1 leucyl/phenylalanyl-tRNA--protein transferase [Galbibacter pacificus]